MSNKIQVIEVESKLSEDQILKIGEENQIKNVKIKTLVFQSMEEVMEYFDDVVDENKSSFVRYNKLSKNFEDTDSYKELIEKLETAKDNYYMFPDSMLEKIRSQKSGTKGCSVCKSSINKDYYITNIEESIKKLQVEGDENTNKKEIMLEKNKLLTCPICKDVEFVISETDKVKLNSLNNKIEEIENKIKERKTLFSLKSEKVEVGVIGFMKEDVVFREETEEDIEKDITEI